MPPIGNLMESHRRYRLHGRMPDNKTHIGYTQYVDNVVYADDAGDDEAGASAYFFAQTQRCPHPLLSIAECIVADKLVTQTVSRTSLFY